jgi:RNase adaptor protein for sRNA GlmZ degradation
MDQAAELLVFPNPAKTQLELRFLHFEPHEISIFQYNGSIVFKKNYPASKNLSLDVQFLPSGFYILKSTTQKGQQAVKLIIENQ